LNRIVEKYVFAKAIFSRKGAKAQSAIAFLKDSLCGFAALRER
jgi:hypothetical protein